MGYLRYHLEGRITRTIYPGIVTERFVYRFPSLDGKQTTATFSSMDEQDLDTLSRLSLSKEVPVLINNNQHYRFMGHFIEMAQKALPSLEVILMRLVEPALVRMVPAMFLEKVFVCQDISEEIEDLKNLRKSFIAFQDHFRIHSFVAGDNTMSVDLYSSEDCTEGFHGIRRGLLGLGVEELSPPVIEDVHEGRD